MSFDINQPVTNPKLIDAWLSFDQQPTVEKQKYLFEQLKEAKLLAPIMMQIPDNVERNDDNSITLQQGTTLSFVTITNVDNENFFPAFTDWEELRKWQNNENQQTLVVDLTDYQSLLNDSEQCIGIVINPFGKGMQINRAMLETILANNSSASTLTENEVSIPEGTKVLIGTPKEYPHQLVDAINKYLQTKAEVNCAYLRLLIQNEQQSFLIVLDINKGIDPKTIFNELGEVIKPYHVKDKFIDFIPADTSFGQEAIKGEKPFYQKKNKGFFNRLFGK